MSTLFHASDLAAMPARYRAQFINCLSGFKSANLLGSIDAHGVTNLAMISSVVHLGADPALLGYITRPQTVRRDSVDNILTTGVFTLNHVTSKMLPAAHQTAAKYPADVSEFSACGFHEGYVEGFAAPFVQEAEISIGLRWLECVPIRHNGTQLVIGQIEWVKVPKAAIHEDGYVAIESLNSVAISGLDGYHKTQRIARYSYPNTADKPIVLASK